MPLNQNLNSSLIKLGPFTAFLLLLSKGVSGNRQSKLILKDLFQKFSYRYITTSSGSLLNLPRYLLKALRLIFNGQSKTIPKNTSVIFDGAAPSENQRRFYLEAIGVTNGFFVSRDNMQVTFSFMEKMGLCCMLFLISILISPLYLFTKDKAKIALVLLELTELAVLSKIISLAGASRCYVFSAYEKDISFCGYYLKHIKGVKVALLPSPNPISIFYKTVVCDHFYFTAPFQEKEYELLKGNWECEKTELIPPPGFMDVTRHQINQVPMFDVGFVSSGGHLRRGLSHTNNFNDADNLAEEATIKVLSRLNKMAKIHVIVYLHPIEKKSKESLDISSKYYFQCFGDNVSFAPFDQPSKKHFNLCKIAVSGFSSAQIERLYGGYKTLFAPMGYLKNYFGDARLDSISANSAAELESMILENLNIEEEQFFSKYHLEQYHYSNYRF